MLTKRKLFALTILAVLSMVLTVCTFPVRSDVMTNETQTHEPNASTTELTDPGRIVTIVIPKDPQSFNAMVDDTGYNALVMELVMLGLTDIDPHGNILAELAVELPTIENGGVLVNEVAGSMSVTWQMRDDVHWQDGKPVTADDVIFTWNAIADPVSGSWVSGSEYIDSIEKVDQYSITINYNTMYPGYLTQFGGGQLAIWPAHYCDAEQGFMAWDCGRQPLSSGPFVLTEWVAGDHMTFTKNENFFVAGKPEIEQVVVRILPDDAVRKTMMLNGDADVDVQINVDTIYELKTSQAVKVSLSPTDRRVMRLVMNQAATGTTNPFATPHPVLSDARVRQAIRMAVDVDTINNQIFHGFAHPVWTEFFRPPYVCDLERPAFDPEAAKVLLEEAGWTDTDSDGVRECLGCETAEEGYKMVLEFTTFARYGEPLELTQQLIAEMLGRIGIQTNTSIVEGSALWNPAGNGGIEQGSHFDILLRDEGYAGLDPTDYLRETYSRDAMEAGNGRNIVRWYNPVVDVLLGEAYTLDEQTRLDTFCAIGDFIHEEAPVVYLFAVPHADVYSSRLEGVQSTVHDSVTWNIADWKLR